MNIAAVYTSPLERAIETAEPLTTRLNLPLVVREALTEIGFGEWQGRTLDSLTGDARWVSFNEFRSRTGAPGGEFMLQTQARLADEFELLRQQHPQQTVAVFSHADVIKAALMLYLGIPLDFHLRLEISPASVSVVELSNWAPRVLAINS